MLTIVRPTGVLPGTVRDSTPLGRTDFTPVNDTVTFAAGETSKTVSIPIADDATDEADKTFTVHLGAGDGDVAGNPPDTTPPPGYLWPRTLVRLIQIGTE